ncbi:MAG: PhnD/SsuA/transferrin family substrate-binding protein [Coriobacteriia bacterium]|nr:PhnD/SsuA/transferrin family substrate-binding protein [Coriobacteriia bacterium]
MFAQMQRDLKRPVVIRYVLSSEDQTHLFQRGQIDVALMSTLAYMDEQAAGRVTLIGTPVVLGEPMDAMFVVVRDDSKARRIEDLRGKRFAVSQDLAGVSFVYWLLKKRGENPDGFFSATPTDVQDENLKKVAKGEVDGTSVRRSALAAWPEGTFRIIERSPELGMPPIVASKSLDEATVDQVRQSLLHAAARGVIPVGSVVTGFRAANDSEYDFARVLDATDRRLEQKAFGSAHQ